MWFLVPGEKVVYLENCAAWGQINIQKSKQNSRKIHKKPAYLKKSEPKIREHISKSFGPNSKPLICILQRPGSFLRDYRNSFETDFKNWYCTKKYPLYTNPNKIYARLALHEKPGNSSSSSNSSSSECVVVLYIRSSIGLLDPLDVRFGSSRDKSEQEL